MKLNIYMARVTEELSGREYEMIVFAESKPLARQLIKDDSMFCGKDPNIKEIRKFPYQAGLWWWGEV